MKVLGTARISAKGGVQIPREIRERYGIQPGDEIDFEDLGWGVRLVLVAKEKDAVGTPSDSSIALRKP